MRRGACSKIRQQSRPNVFRLLHPTPGHGTGVATGKEVSCRWQIGHSSLCHIWMWFEQLVACDWRDPGTGCQCQADHPNLEIPDRNVPLLTLSVPQVQSSTLWKFASGLLCVLRSRRRCQKAPLGPSHQRPSGLCPCPGSQVGSASPALPTACLQDAPGCALGGTRRQWDCERGGRDFKNPRRATGHVLALMEQRAGLSRTVTAQPTLYTTSYTTATPRPVPVEWPQTSGFMLHVKEADRNWGWSPGYPAPRPWLWSWRTEEMCSQ
ncbi:uncharacterized protein LOC104872383 isoform X2 [Fukomys damarensis]|uniref:uncharacterized protein LOC104872383 isoform X2 n=1 Tax=Fukomys damarensis TaxID=885580 RepID=UPI00053FADC5|nr:uncharacterized protein LOC104872383 isoform X2 [Fukomys damarensis]